MVEAFKKMDPMTYGGAKYASYATSRLLLVRSNLEDRKPMRMFAAVVRQAVMHG